MRQLFSPVHCICCFLGFIIFSLCSLELKAKKNKVGNYLGQLTVFTTATQEENALQLFLQIKIRKGWYIYSVKKTSSSISTKIELLDKAWQLQEIEESAPIKIYDEIFQDFLFVHQNTAEFKIKALQKNNHLIPKVITGNLIFSICNQKSCSLPQRKIFKTEVF